MTATALAWFSKVILTYLSQVAETNPCGILIHLPEDFCQVVQFEIVSLLILKSSTVIGKHLRL